MLSPPLSESMILLDLRNKLSQRNLEAALKQPPFSSKHSPANPLKQMDLTVDLSRVGWVEPVAAVRVALLIEDALLEGANVRVRMPFPTATHAEKKILDSALRSKDPALSDKARFTAININRRSKAAEALRHLRFKEALAHDHIARTSGGLTISDDYDRSSGDEASPVADAAATGVAGEPTSSWDFEVAYGLQWIPDPRKRQGKEIIDHLSKVDVLGHILSHPSGRISGADGRTLAHVFLKELVENAIDHSGREYALVAAWRRPQGYDIKESEVFECEREFVGWCRQHPLIEVIVGDSGEGIPSSLSGSFDSKQPRLPDTLQKGSRDTRVMAWAFDKWSSKLSIDHRRGTRGLYRVQRIVRKYDGCITIRSGRSYVGIESGFNNPPDYIFEPEKRNTPRSPGTVVHVRLPVMLSERLPDRPHNPALHKARMQVIDFRSIDWENEDQALDEVCVQILERCEAFASALRPICLVADFAYSKIERRALEKLLIRLVELAHPVALVVANVMAPSADSAEETIHSIAQQIAPREAQDATAEQPEALHVCDAILFQYTDGAFAWVGVADDLVSHLNLLWEKENITADELALAVPDREERNMLIRRFAEAYHIAHRVPGGGLALNFNGQDVRECLIQHVAALLRSKVNTGGSEAISKGKFRTPSLELVSRYTQVKPLLEEIGLDRASAVLVQKCADIGALLEARQIQIIADWNTSRDLIERFRDYLCLSLKLSINDIEIHQISQGDAPVVREDCEIILFTDLILTGDTAGTLISQVIRARSIPAVVVTVFDARREIERGETLSTMGYHIAMVSLAQIDIWVMESEAGRDPVNISPVTHEPEIGAKLLADDDEYEINRKHLVEMIEKEDALYFDHIVRPNGRHFVFYLDPFKLLGALDTADQTDLSEIGHQVIDRSIRTINKWLGLEDRIDCIYFPNLPRSERPSPTKLIVAKELAQIYRADVVPVEFAGIGTMVASQLPRLVRSAQRLPPTSPNVQPFLFEALDSEQEAATLPPNAQPEPQRCVLIVDWGSVTGTAIRSSIRFAIARGAERIFVLVFLSQLPLGEEKFLMDLTRIARPQWAGNQGDCEISVTFLARFPIQVYDAQSCPYCRQLSRLNEEKRFLPSDLLIEFIKDAKNRLGRRYLDGKDGIREQHRWQAMPDNIAKQAAASIDPRRNVARIAEIRDLLEKGKSSTTWRWELYKSLDQIETLIEGGDRGAKLRRSCFVSLLAAEWPWLKQEPLTLVRFKRQIARLAVATIKDHECSVRERLDAVVVLRTASKDAFANNLPSLFEVAIGDEGLSEQEREFLLSQLLYCAFTYLQRDYLMEVTLRPLVEALGKCAARVNELLSQPKPIAALRVGQTVNALQQYGRFMLLARDDVSPPDAWRRLRQEFGREYHVHHPVCEAFDALRLGPLLEREIDNRLSELPVMNWTKRRDRWEQTCEPFIVQTVLPLLRPLREVFEGLDCKVMAGETNAEILALVEGRIFTELSTLSHSLEVFANDPSALRQPGAWRRFVQARDALWRLLLDPGALRQDDSRRGGSALVRLLQECPTDLVAIAKEFVGKSLSDRVLTIELANAPDSGESVFCHSSVLRDTMSQLLDNVRVHVAEDTSRFPIAGEESDRRSDCVSGGVPVKIVLTEEHSRVHLQILNGGKVRKSRTPGHGLEMCRQRLRPYGATLVKIDEQLPAPWVFGVRLTLLRG